MRKITLLISIATLALAMALPASAQRRDMTRRKMVEGRGVVIESTRDKLTLVGGIQLKLNYRTRIVNEQGEEIPRERLLTANRGRGSRTRGTTSVGLGVVEYEGIRDGKRIRATRVTPLFQNEAQ